MGRKFLIIDDSALMRRVISDIIKQNSEYEVLDIACNGAEGLDILLKHPEYYDLILTDINMPKMSGLELLENLYDRHMKEPVAVVSTLAREGAVETLKALELGAVDFVTKPGNFNDVKDGSFRDDILNLIEMVCSPDFNSSGRRARPKAQPIVPQPVVVKPKTPLVKKRPPVNKEGTKIVALACSTGGPKSLQQVIPYLPSELDAAVVLVQHMPKGFTSSLAARLDSMSEMKVQEAEDGMPIEKGNVYIAPGGMHITVEKKGQGHVIRYEDIPPVDSLKPCANIMYRSLVSSGYDEIICVVLTGMGADGTAGIKSLYEAGRNIHVISQDAESCVVYGMPRAVAQAGLSDEVVPLNKISESIIKNVGVS